MPPRLRGGRGRGNRGHVARLDDIGQPRRSLSDHLEREDEVYSMRGEHIGDVASGAYQLQLIHHQFHQILNQHSPYLLFKLMLVWELFLLRLL